MRVLPALLFAAALLTALPASASGLNLRLSCRLCAAAEAPLPPPPPPPPMPGYGAIPPAPGEIAAASSAREQELRLELATVIRSLEELGMNLPLGPQIAAGVAALTLYFSLAVTLTGLLVLIFDTAVGAPLAIGGGLVMGASIAVLVVVGSQESDRKTERLRLAEERHRLQLELKRMHGASRELPWSPATPLLSLAF